MYEEERRFSPHHPALLTALLLYGYTQGVFSLGGFLLRHPRGRLEWAMVATTYNLRKVVAAST